MDLPFRRDDASNPRRGTIQTRPERVRDGTQTRQMFLTVPAHNLIRTAGQQVRRIDSGFGYSGENPILTGTRCASVNGFSLHANTHIPAPRCDQLERLLRYTARGAVSLERLEQDANGDLLYTFTRPWSDGTTGIKLSPLDLLEKLAALAPLPRVHLVRYGGCLAPHSKLRGAIIPTPCQLGAAAQAGVCHRYGALPHVSARHVADHRGDF